MLPIKPNFFFYNQCKGCESAGDGSVVYTKSFEIPRSQETTVFM